MDANKKRKKILPLSVALDKDTPTSSLNANAWDSIYKNRAKSMVSIQILIHTCSVHVLLI